MSFLDVSDEELAKGQEELRKLAAVVARVERERTGAGTIVAKALRRVEEAMLDASPEDVAADNASQDHESVIAAEGAESHLAAAIRLRGLTSPAAATILATLVLTSVDPDFRCRLRNIPSAGVSVERSWAHLHSLGLGMGPRAEASLARLTTLSLLNRRAARSAYEDAGVTKLPAPQPTSQPRQVIVDKPLLAVASSVADDALAPPGRVIAGFGSCAREVAWRIGGESVRMSVGEPLLLLDPTDLEREQSRQANEVIIWWRGKARRLPSADVQPLRRAEYVRRMAGNL